MTKSRGILRPRGTVAAWLAAQTPRPCECGCGGDVLPKRGHYFKGAVPRFLLGHNSRVDNPNYRPRPAQAPCACGCAGHPKTPGRRYCAGHNSQGRSLSDDARLRLSESKRGALNPGYGKRPANYKGRQVTVDGYVTIHSPDHPFGGVKGYVFEHRLVLEAHLREVEPSSPYLVASGDGLYLSPEVEVHHANGVKDDNRVENLEPMSKAEHAAHHMLDRLSRS